jgi:nucleotide-binding universal stress UspA family protein
VIGSIVVGTDGSDTAAVAVREAGDLAQRLGARVHIVSAYEPISARLAGAGGDPESGEWAVGPDVEVNTVLERAAGALRTHGVECETHARKARDPAEAILRIAEEYDADLIIVGSKGMQGGKRFLLGSVPNKISHHAPCSVLIVRTT